MLRSGRPVHARWRRRMMDWMSCASMPGSPRKLALQDLGRTVKYWSMIISHVHWTRQFKQFWSRQYMPSYYSVYRLAQASSCTDWTSNASAHVATHEQCCFLLPDGSELRIRCTGDRLQRRVSYVF